MKDNELAELKRERRDVRRAIGVIGRLSAKRDRLEIGEAICKLDDLRRRLDRMIDRLMDTYQ